MSSSAHELMQSDCLYYLYALRFMPSTGKMNIFLSKHSGVSCIFVCISDGDVVVAFIVRGSLFSLCVCLGHFAVVCDGQTIKQFFCTLKMYPHIHTYTTDILYVWCTLGYGASNGLYTS